MASHPPGNLCAGAVEGVGFCRFACVSAYPGWLLMEKQIWFVPDWDLDRCAEIWGALLYPFVGLSSRLGSWVYLGWILVGFCGFVLAYINPLLKNEGF